MKKFLATLTIALGAAFGLAGCSAPSVEITPDTVVIDVRTPAEFASGHLEGAVNIDVQSPDFAQKVSELDPEGDYFIYCRSGNRSQAAISQMHQMGFQNMTDGKSVQEASKMSGLDIVTN